MGGDKIMKPIIENIKQNKLIIGLLIFLLVAVGLAYWWTNRPYTGPTGGQGQPAKNTVVVTGWDQKTDQDTELGEVISAKQQADLARLLSQKIQQIQGEFDYRQVEVVTSSIKSHYDKVAGIDQTEFQLKLANYKQPFQAVLDHNQDSVLLK